MSRGERGSLFGAAFKGAALAIIAVSFAAFAVSSKGNAGGKKRGKEEAENTQSATYTVWQIRVVRFFLYAAMSLFVLTHFTYLFSHGSTLQKLKESGLREMSDYATFGLPCAAAMFAGIGFVGGKQTRALITDVNGRSFIYSVLLLLIAFCAYLWSHPSLLVIAFAAFYDLAACLLSLWIVGRRPIEEPKKKRSMGLAHGHLSRRHPARCRHVISARLAVCAGLLARFLLDEVKRGEEH